MGIWAVRERKDRKELYRLHYIHPTTRARIRIKLSFLNVLTQVNLKFVSRITYN